MAGFVLADILKSADVPKMDTGLQQIDIDRLHPDPKNFYTVEPDSVRELAGNIATIGLQQPLNVRPEGQDYVVISGHRRLAALRLLIEEDGREELRTVPCMVAAAGSEALNELRLIYGNANTRKLTDWELSRQAERVEELFYQLKEEGFEFPGRMRDHVAAACQASKSKLARLKVIRDNLKPLAFREAFAQGALSESAAYEIARRAPEVQERAAEASSWFQSVTADQVTAMLDTVARNLAEEQAEKESVAEGLDTIERHFAQDEQTVASVADGLDRLSGAPGYDRAQAYLAARAEQDAKYFAVMQHYARRFASGVLSTAGMNRNENIQRMKEGLKNSSSWADYRYEGVASALRLADEDTPWDYVSRTWTDAYDSLAAACIRIVAELEDADEDDTIKPQWQTGEPDAPGEYWVKLDFGDGEPPMVDSTRWDGVQWRITRSTYDAVTVVGWWPLPEV